MVNTFASVIAKDGACDRRKIHPGKVTDEALENGNGENGLRYSFGIKRGNTAENHDWA
ncbi:MAG TPA: hypothetical protein VMV88_00930 [Gallionella sp.]|nr:hypothetical protein [Gallionella sp.]